jgi:hypothetical protein
MEKMANTSDGEGGGGYLRVFGIGRIVDLIFRNYRYQSAVQQVADLVPNPARYFDFFIYI